MRKINLVLAFAILTIALNAQKRAVISKVTATWCPNCGSWGWELAEELKAIYAGDDSDALLLGVHHSGDLENPVADWFATNLDFSYQPQFFVNDEFLNIGSNNWSQKVQELSAMAEEFVSSAESQSNFSFRGPHYVDPDGNFNVTIDIDAMDDPQNEFYIAVYVYENNVVNRQSNQTGDVEHPNVLRDVISTNNFGDKYLTPGFGGKPAQTVKFKWEANPDYNSDNIGFLAIMWEKDGDRYILDNSIATSAQSFTSSSEDLFDQDFKIEQGQNSISIDSEKAQMYNLDIFDLQGKRVYLTTFSERTVVDTSELTSGMYVLMLTNGKERSTKKNIYTLIFCRVVYSCTISCLNLN